MAGFMEKMEKGQRVRLIKCTDTYSRRPYGLEGTVICTDDVGTVHVRWDDGSVLGAVPGEDIIAPIGGTK